MIKGTPIIPKSDYLIEIDNAFGFVEGIQSEYDFFKPFDELIEFVEKRIEIEENKIEAEKEKFEQEFEQSMSLEEEYYRYGYSFGLRHNFLKAVYLTIYSQFEGSMKQLGYLTNKFKPGANPFDFNRSDDSLNYFISYIESRTIPKKSIRTKEEKKELLVYRDIRNSIAHSDFIIEKKKSNESMIDFCLKSPNIEEDYFYEGVSTSQNYYKFFIKQSDFIRQATKLFKKIFVDAIKIAQGL